MPPRKSPKKARKEAALRLADFIRLAVETEFLATNGTPKVRDILEAIAGTVDYEITADAADGIIRNAADEAEILYTALTLPLKKERYL